ncbi:MAG: dihydroorotase [Verrucomicrobiota bacterium]
MFRLFRSAQIASEDSPKLTEADILVGEDGKIAGVGNGLAAPDGAEVEEVDCAGEVILPGLFDVHVHLREPGRPDKETIQSGSEAAINGGVTGIVAMPNVSPAPDNGGAVRSILDIAKKTSRIPVWTTGCITKNREGKEMAGIAGMVKAGVVMITDDGDPVEDPSLLRGAMEYAREFDLPVASHCEVKALSRDGAMNEGKVSYALGIPGIPAISEEICLDRDIRIGQYTGCHIHIQHVTSARGMETIRSFKEAGVKVTCEVAPHHLLFNEEDIGNYDTHYKMNPPLRTAEDNELLLQGLIDGVFDVIATDHAPHTEFEKQQLDFVNAPFGITGLETALPSLFHYFVKTEKFGWDLIVKRYSAEPRRLMKMAPVEIKEGELADFVVFDPGRETVFTRDFMRSKSDNTPFLDKTLDGLVTQVMLGNELLLSR